METANGALPAVEGDVCLRDARVQTVCLELALTEGPGEEATLVAVWLEVDDTGARQLRVDAVFWIGALVGVEENPGEAVRT